MKTVALTRSLSVAVALGLATMALSHADSDRLLPRDVPVTYTQECGSCHTAYPPGMLPARSWQRIMRGLDQHYGTDAAVDAATARQLERWLQAHAGTTKRVREEPPQDRITRSAWFERKHRKVDPVVWKHPGVKSPANCSACHPGADQGDYDDDRLQVPAGLDTRLRRAWKD